MDLMRQATEQFDEANDYGYMNVLANIRNFLQRSDVVTILDARLPHTHQQVLCNLDHQLKRNENNYINTATTTIHNDNHGDNRNGDEQYDTFDARAIEISTMSNLSHRAVTYTIDESESEDERLSTTGGNLQERDSELSHFVSAFEKDFDDIMHSFDNEEHAHNQFAALNLTELGTKIGKSSIDGIRNSSGSRSTDEDHQDSMESLMQTSQLQSFLETDFT